MDIFDSKQDIDHVAKCIDNSVIEANDYNLSVSSYVTAKDNREQVDITILNAEIAKTVVKINMLRADIDNIINEIEG
jgi:type I restriction enzyme M protein